MKRKIKKYGTISSIIILMTLIFSVINVTQTAKGVTAPAAPTLLKAVSTSYNSITVSWGTVRGATGYRLYRASSSSGRYSLITTTTSKKYINTRLTTGKTYYYKVRAYIKSGSKKIYGRYSLVVSSKAIPTVPTKVNAAVSSYNSISISWEAVTGASGYRIYRSTSITGIYTYLASTTSASYKNTGLTTGANYFYKVRAFRTVSGNNVYSAYSYSVNAKPYLFRPDSVNAVSPSYNTIAVSWGKVSGANGYELYKADNSVGKYTLLATTAETTYNDTGLKTASTFYYEVRAYRIVGNSKVYSSFSSIVSGSTPVVNVTNITLSKSTVGIKLGSTYKLTAKITPSYATNPSVTWSSSDTSVVEVSNTGTLTPVDLGTAVVTVTNADSNKTATCTVTVSSAEIKGIDVSKWQGTIDWAAIEDAGIQFAMLRSSYGSTNVDPKFELNYTNAKANGIAVGVYHYSYATTVAKAKTEADFFISKLAGKQFEYPVCVDIEDSSQSKLDSELLTEIALVYLDKLQDAGYYPMIYTNKNWYETNLDDSQLTDYDHWLAQWGSSITYTGPVGIWQYTSSGSLSGISGRVDLDISYVDYASKIKTLHRNGY